MAKAPESPKYGPPYTPPGSSDSTPDPDKGKDLWSLVPDLAVPAPWNGQPGPPSFDDDPPGDGGPHGPGDGGSVAPDPGGSGDPSDVIPDCPAFHVDLGSLNSGMASILGELQAAIPEYQDLKSAVQSNKDTVFGQNAIETRTGDDPGLASGGGGSGMPAVHTGPSPIQQPARDFAAGINPYQERALEMIANSIEAVGQFVAMVDRSGQAYASGDRKAVFPEAPAYTSALPAEKLR